MPHAGLMDEKELGAVNGPLQRARLHLRAGKRRLGQGKISAGIVTLYDAVLAAFDWYAASHDFIKIGENSTDEKAFYELLVRSGVLDGSFDFNGFDTLTEKALHQELRDCDYHQIVDAIAGVMGQLGVMPFDETTLPPEDPQTF